jgi:predicted negative regulator of RcsB-dependent stress response
MADEDIDVSKPKEPPKPVHIGGESLADRIIPHLKKIIVSVVVIAVILSVVFGIRAWNQSKQAEQTAKIARVMEVAQRKVAPPGTPEAARKDMFADTKARAVAVLDEMAKQGVDVSPAFRGAMLLDAGRVDEAIVEYRKAKVDPSLESVLAREGLGIAIETKALAEKDSGARQKLLEEALAAFVAMQPDKDGPRRGFALYHQGRIQQILGKTAEAKALYEQAKALETTAGTELAQLLDTRLATLGAS